MLMLPSLTISARLVVHIPLYLLPNDHFLTVISLDASPVLSVCGADPVICVTDKCSVMGHVWSEGNCDIVVGSRSHAARKCFASSLNSTCSGPGCHGMQRVRVARLFTVSVYPGAQALQCAKFHIERPHETLHVGNGCGYQ